MDNRELALYCIDNIKARGAHKASCSINYSKNYEFNYSESGMDLLRTTIDTNVGFLAIKDNKLGSLGLNKLDKITIDEKIDELIDICNSAEADTCNDISDYQPKETFSCGPKEPNLDKLYDLIKNFMVKMKKEFPKVRIMDGTACGNFVTNEVDYVNTNGVEFKIHNSIYTMSIGYLAKEGEKSSSFDIVGYNFCEIPEDFMEFQDVRQRLEDITKQIECNNIGKKFVGDVILTPAVVADMVMMYDMTFLGDEPLIMGTSILKDKLNEKVASDKFTLMFKPVGEEIVNKNFVTGDGFKSENVTIIENGVLKSFDLSLYGAKKTGKTPSKTLANIVIKPGSISKADIIKSVERGIVLGRFSGGSPSNNGDFSGVAKNSFYIENGEIKYPLVETMITSNLYEMFNNIEAISCEVIESVDSVIPWIKVKAVNISG